MPWKVDDTGAPTMVNGNPVWVDGGGREMAVDEKHFQSAAEARREAGERRLRIEEIEAKLEATEQQWEGLSPEETRKAMAELDRLKKSQRKAKDGGDEDTAARIAELEQELESERTRLETLSKESESAKSELESLRTSARRSALETWLGRSKYFSTVNGQDAPLSVLSPKLALPIIGDFLDVDEHGQVIGVWPKGHAKAGKRILNRDGEIARGDEIADVLFDSVEDLKPALRKQSVSGADSNAGGKDLLDTATRHTARIRDMSDAQKAEFIRANNLSPEEYGKRLEADMQKG